MHGPFGSPSGVRLWCYPRVLNDLARAGGKLAVFEWRSAGYQFPDRRWDVENAPRVSA